MTTEESENINDCWNCWGFTTSLGQYWEEKKRKIAGRLGISLSVLNIIFIGLDNIFPTQIGRYIIAAMISAGVFIGGIMFERMANENKMLEDDNRTQKEFIRRYTQYNEPVTNTPISDTSIEAVNFVEIHRNNIIAFPPN